MFDVDFNDIKIVEVKAIDGTVYKYPSWYCSMVRKMLALPIGNDGEETDE